MDSFISWGVAVVMCFYGAYAFAKWALVEVENKRRASEADWIRLETEWGR